MFQIPDKDVSSFDSEFIEALKELKQGEHKGYVWCI